MKIFVINLKGARERRENIVSQFSSLGTKFQFYEAVEPDDAFVSFDGYDEKRYLLNTGRKASPGEAACFASHRNLWKHAISIEEPIIVLEDDSELDENFDAAVNATATLIEQCGFIRLQNDFSGRHKKKTPVTKIGRFTLNYFATYPFGTMGYAISPTTAAAFLDSSRILSAPVDSFIKLFWEHGHPLYGLAPYAVVWGDLSRRTTIKRRERERTSIGMKLLRRRKKASDWVRRWRFNQRHRPNKTIAKTQKILLDLNTNDRYFPQS